MSQQERAELADIKRRWSAILDAYNDDEIKEVGVALWAALNVDRLIQLAEVGAA